jgi:hypothetical protein
MRLAPGCSPGAEFLLAALPLASGSPPWTLQPKGLSRRASVQEPGLIFSVSTTISSHCFTTMQAHPTYAEKRHWEREAQ